MATATISRVCQSVRGGFNRSGYLELKNVSLEEVDEGVVRMQGTVPSYYLKQLATALGITSPGVLRVDNAIEVE
jgi:hypothetical protein